MVYRVPPFAIPATRHFPVALVLPLLFALDAVTSVSFCPALAKMGVFHVSAGASIGSPLGELTVCVSGHGLSSSF